MENIARNYEYYRTLAPERYPDEVKYQYKKRTGKDLDLENPRTFNEKIQWLKLYGNTPIKTRLADKYLVRAWVREKIGEEYLVPLLGVWDRFDDIDFDKLPNQFVLKANHGCGWNIIVRDKAFLDIAEAKRQMDYWLKKNYALAGLEFHYADIPPKIIAEEYMENLDGDMPDYKFWCFDGKVCFIQLTTHHQDGTHSAFFSQNWERMHFVTSINKHLDGYSRMPDGVTKMISLAEKLAEGFPHVRVDLYLLDNGSIKFGEMTFTSASGMCHWDPPETDLLVGELLHLPADKIPLPDKSFAERGVQQIPNYLIKRETDIRLRVQQEVQEREKLEELLQKTKEDRDSIHARLKQADEDKCELRATLQKVNDEKAALKETLSQSQSSLQQSKAAYSTLEKQFHQLSDEKKALDAHLQRVSDEKNALNVTLQQTYAEKSEINATLQRTYAEKSEINAKLQQTYAEKAERGLRIKDLESALKTEKKRLATEKKKNEKLKKSLSYRIGHAITWPFRKVKHLLRRVAESE